MFDEKTRAPFLFIVQLDDESVGFLSYSADTIVPIPSNRLPLHLQRDIALAKKH
jgi:hypothetical protein